ncbi:MAG: Gldg family protein [bacterium]|nr:Gldg family protein [bacterium]
MNRKLKKGGYSAVLTLVVLAIVIAVNMLASQIPEDKKQLDISGKDLYTLSDTTKELLGSLDKDVTLYVVSDPSRVDERIQKIAEHYAAASSHIRVESLDPVLHPSVLSEYEATDQSILVSCEETGKRETIPFTDIIVYDQMSMYYGQYQESEFDGEGQLSSAISLVTSEVNKKIYRTEGHDEEALSTSVQDLLAKSNLELDTVNLLTDNGVPEDADMLIINAPQRDLAEDEREMLSEYLNGGGQVMLLIGPSDTDRPNFTALAEEFGLDLQNGYLADTQAFYRNNPYYIFPTFVSGSTILSGISSQNPALVIDAMGMKQMETLPDGVTVIPFLTTTEGGVLVQSNHSQQEGEYLIAAAATKNVDDETTARLTVIAAPSLISETVTASFSNVSNLTIFMNALTAGFDDVQNISIPTKSLAETYNTIINGGMWGILFIAVIPVLLLVSGLLIWMKRRKL